MIDTPETRRLISLALDEDLGGGDITSELIIAEAEPGQARILAREDLVACGLPLLPIIVAEMKWTLEVDAQVEEGVLVQANTTLAVLKGKLRQILTLERTMLNFLQHLSGIATMTRAWVRAAGELKVLDTRKTTPGWRELEKYAVRVGGGINHRKNMSELILIKNNHIDAAGGVAAALERVAAKRPPGLKIEVEVRDIFELKTALAYEPELIMLDNMDDAQISEAVKIIEAGTYRPTIEVSGGVSYARLARLKNLGADCVSSGALTTRAPAVDISLRVQTLVSS